MFSKYKATCMATLNLKILCIIIFFNFRIKRIWKKTEIANAAGVLPKESGAKKVKFNEYTLYNVAENHVKYGWRSDHQT